MSKGKTLGKAEKRRYDLPLNRSTGTGFLMILIGLMTFLGILALALSFTLSAMTHRWTSGLENRLTIEIPAQTADGALMDHQAISTSTRNVASALRGLTGITSIHVLSDEEISKLVEPWLGDDLLKGDFPIPGIISVETSQTNARILKDIRSRIAEAAPNARMDTHEEWLNDLLRFTGALQLGALILTLVIGMTTVTAVAGAIRSRLAINRAEVELLHLIGANDRYITRQFQRHSLILALRGGIAGAVAGAAALMLIGWVAGQMGVAILPDFHLSPVQTGLLALVPVAAAAIATLTARWTVLRVLATFP
jgi:cell division transport system permease protein